MHKIKKAAGARKPTSWERKAARELLHCHLGLWGQRYNYEADGNFSAAREIDLRMRKITNLLIEAEANGIRYR